MAEEGTIFCWETTKWGSKRVLGITKDDCRRCSISRDCESGFDFGENLAGGNLMRVLRQVYLHHSWQM